MAALLSGEIDFISPIPLQDVPRTKERSGFTVHEGVEARVMMFGFSGSSETLAFGEDAGDPNPFLDPRVRRAAYQAIDVDALVSKVMRRASEPVAQLVSKEMRGYSTANAERLPMIRTELDDAKRRDMIDEVTRILQDEVAYVPMYVQPLVGASKDSVELTRRTDDFFILRWVNVGG